MSQDILGHIANVLILCCFFIFFNKKSLASLQQTLKENIDEKETKLRQGHAQTLTMQRLLNLSLNTADANKNCFCTAPKF